MLTNWVYQSFLTPKIFQFEIHLLEQTHAKIVINTF